MKTDQQNHYERNNVYVQNAYGNLVGRRIARVRPMLDDEMDDFGWYEGYGSIPMVIILDDDTVLVPSADPEGNGAGHIFVEKLGD